MMGQHVVWLHTFQYPTYFFTTNHEKVFSFRSDYIDYVLLWGKVKSQIESSVHSPSLLVDVKSDLSGISFNASNTYLKGFKKKGIRFLDQQASSIILSCY